MDWNFNMSEAPRGKVLTLKSKDGKRTMSQFIPEPCHVLLNGKVYQTWRLEDGRWNGFTKDQEGDAWVAFPKPPNTYTGK